MISLFFSYSHHDETYRDQLEIHLSVLKRNGVISTWHDRRVVGGEDFTKEISENLEGADIVLLLVSPHFLASDYCYEVEMQRALERHKKGQATVLPVILRPCDWHDAPFGRLLAVPKDGRPIMKYPNIDDAFLEVVEEVKRIASRKKSEKPKIQESIARQATPQAESEPKKVVRSSNLRIKKTYSDQDRDSFQTEAFEYISKFFENSLNELALRNANVGINYRRINANRFSATIYVDGKETSCCTIFLAEKGSYNSGIMYSYGHSSGDSYNESLSVEYDGFALYLKALGMGFGVSKHEEKLTMEGAAEYYWDMFIKPLQ